jgi:hypothetical protein
MPKPRLPIRANLRGLYLFIIKRISSVFFGETMAGQHSLTQDYETPYKFNAKELDVFIRVLNVIALVPFGKGRFGFLQPK